MKMVAALDGDLRVTLHVDVRSNVKTAMVRQL